MNTETLKKANELAKLISEHESALLCFEYDANEWINQNKSDDEKLPPKIESTHPQLVIVHDDIECFDGGRVEQPIPMILSDFLINIIKDHIKENLEKLKIEFENL